MDIYKCDKCGTIVGEINSGKCQPSCCGQPMTKLEPGTSDGASEKHIPICLEKDNKIIVVVSSTKHPMTEEHYIEWIALETNMGIQRKELKPGDTAKAEFLLLEGEKFKAAYEYCNLHSLWKSKRISMPKCLDCGKCFR